MRETSVAIDTAVGLVCVGIGRTVHAHELNFAGLVSTAWPFLAGMAAGWLVVTRRRHVGTSLWDGVTVAVSTVGLGMVLRVISGQGTAVAFVLVAFGFLGAAMLGWRLAREFLRRRRLTNRVS